MEDLRTYKKDINSQSGEDGVIEKIFALVPPKNKWCVELGALNGVHDSNTRHLITDKGWSAALIEPDTIYFERLQKTYEGVGRVHCVNEFVDFTSEHSLDALLAQTPIPKDFDLLSLDIDGNEYHIWSALENYQPQLVVVECNPTIPNDIVFIQPRDMSVQQGSSAQAFVELAHTKGYALCTITGSNLFFIRKELLPMLGMPEPTLDELQWNNDCLTRVFQLYDGTLVLDGCQQLLWRGGMAIDQEKIQVLPKRKRRYIAGISADPAVRRLTYWYRKLPVYTTLQRLRGKLH